MTMQEKLSMGNGTLSLAPMASHIANPFNYLSDNVFNFSVREKSTEKWIYIYKCG
jgi:hypothetical protein